jgi:hypothetical protein
MVDKLFIPFKLLTSTGRLFEGPAQGAQSRVDVDVQHGRRGADH